MSRSELEALYVPLRKLTRLPPVQPYRPPPPAGRISSIPLMFLWCVGALFFALHAAFYDWLEAHMDELLATDPQALAHVIRRSCEIKAQIVGRDEREHGDRALSSVLEVILETLHFAEAHDGGVTVKNRPKGGAVFTLSLRPVASLTAAN